MCFLNNIFGSHPDHRSGLAQPPWYNPLSGSNYPPDVASYQAQYAAGMSQDHYSKALSQMQGYYQRNLQDPFSEIWDYLTVAERARLFRLRDYRKAMNMKGADFSEVN